MTRPMLRVRRLCMIIVLCAITLPVIAQEAPIIYVVQRGDTLFRIAQQYNTTIEALARANGLAAPSSIQVGQRLIIVTSDAPLSPSVHIVQPGETLAGIAQLYGMTLDALMQLNPLPDPGRLVVGQQIILSLGSDPVPPPEVEAGTNSLDRLPELSAPIDLGGMATGPASTVALPDAPQSVIHTVLPGETLMRIAVRYGVAVTTIIQTNAIPDPSLIYAGQQLVIPGVPAPQLTAALPAPVTNAQLLPLVFNRGKTGMFRLTTAAPATVTGTFLDSVLTFAPSTDGLDHRAIIGIPLATAAGVYPVTMTVTDGVGASVSVSANVQVVDGDYSTEQFTLLADRANLLDPAIDEAEYNLLQSVTRRFTPTRYFAGALGLPAAATITSPFGSTRAYEGGATRTHIGTDFAGVPGTPIVAAADGVVVLADTLNVRGVATILDHGWGIYSGYYHQTERYVGIGETVTEGQVIGTIGSSGRVSGPHLHWELWVGGVPVDPMQWVIIDFAN